MSDRERIVLTIGTFDTPHLGHAFLFKECARYGTLVVGVNSDEFVEAYKGKPPVYKYRERCEMIEWLGYEVIKNDSAGIVCIDYIEPDVLAIGSDWARKDYYAQVGITQDYLDEHYITMIYIPRVMEVSSTQLKERLG